MTGHSKWHSIKHKKGAADAARGKLFAVLIRQIEVAAQSGGGDPDSNATLRTMIQKARDNSVPIDNIQRAIKRGTGEEEGVTYEAGDVRGLRAERCRGDRAGAHRQPQPHVGAEIKNIFSRNGGSFAEPGAVVVAVRAQGHRHRRQVAADEDELMLAAADAGAEDVARPGRHVAGHDAAHRAARGAHRDRRGRHRGASRPTSR